MWRAAEKRIEKGFTDIQFSVSCRICDLWNDQLSDAGDTELVLVCCGRLSVCMDGCRSGIF